MEINPLFKQVIENDNFFKNSLPILLKLRNLYINSDNYPWNKECHYTGEKADVNQLDKYKLEIIKLIGLDTNDEEDLKEIKYIFDWSDTYRDLLDIFLINYNFLFEKYESNIKYFKSVGTSADSYKNTHYVSALILDQENIIDEIKNQPIKPLDKIFELLKRNPKYAYVIQLHRMYLGHLGLIIDRMKIEDNNRIVISFNNTLNEIAANHAHNYTEYVKNISFVNETEKEIFNTVQNFLIYGIFYYNPIVSSNDYAEFIRKDSPTNLFIVRLYHDLILNKNINEPWKSNKSIKLFKNGEKYSIRYISGSIPTSKYYIHLIKIITDNLQKNENYEILNGYNHLLYIYEYLYSIDALFLQDENKVKLVYNIDKSNCTVIINYRDRNDKIFKYFDNLMTYMKKNNINLLSTFLSNLREPITINYNDEYIYYTINLLENKDEIDYYIKQTHIDELENTLKEINSLTPLDIFNVKQTLIMCKILKKIIGVSNESDCIISDNISDFIKENDKPKPQENNPPTNNNSTSEQKHTIEDVENEKKKEKIHEENTSFPKSPDLNLDKLEETLNNLEKNKFIEDMNKKKDLINDITDETEKEKIANIITSFDFFIKRFIKNYPNLVRVYLNDVELNKKNYKVDIHYGAVINNGFDKLEFIVNNTIYEYLIGGTIFKELIFVNNGMLRCISNDNFVNFLETGLADPNILDLDNIVFKILLSKINKTSII